jgi:hypothetical protein
MSDLKIDDIFLYLLLLFVFCYFMKYRMSRNNIESFESLEGGTCGYPGGFLEYPESHDDLKKMANAMATRRTSCFPGQFGAPEEACHTKPTSEACLLPQTLTEEEIYKACNQMCYNERRRGAFQSCRVECANSWGERTPCSEVVGSCKPERNGEAPLSEEECKNSLSIGTTDTTPCEWQNLDI